MMDTHITRRSLVALAVAALATGLPATAHAGLLDSLGIRYEHDDAGQTDEAQSSSAPDTAPDAAPDTAPPISTASPTTQYYISRLRYYHPAEDFMYEEDVLEYDERGNCLSEVDYEYEYNPAADKPELRYAGGVAFDYDESGIPLIQTIVEGDDLSPAQAQDVTVITDELGRPIEFRTESVVRTYTYYDTGSLERRVNAGASGYTHAVEFDESGWPVEKEFEYSDGDPGAAPSVTRMSYDYDETGAVEYIHVQGPEDKPQRIYLCQCDENGNVVTIFDERPRIVREIEWFACDDPTPFAAANNVRYFAYGLE